MDERHAYWLAALIDGEGCIVIRTRKGRSTPYVEVKIAQNDRRLLDVAQERVEGRGTIYGGIGPRKNGHWLIFQRQADVRAVLTAVEPYLVLKGEKAREALNKLP